jgi:hypothetical protein
MPISIHELFQNPSFVQVLYITSIISAIVAVVEYVASYVTIEAIATAVLTTAASFALQALTAPESNDPFGGGGTNGGGGGGLKKNFKQSITHRRIVYGKRRIGGPIIFAESNGKIEDADGGKNNKYLHMVIAHASHPSKEIVNYYANDVKLDLDSNGVNQEDEFGNFIRIREHLGSFDQTADSQLVSETDKWTDDHRLRGITYTYVRLEWDVKTFGKIGIPTITVELKGKSNIFDPRSGQYIYTDNSALCTADYLRSDRVGFGTLEGEISEKSVASAANVCDETVLNNDGSEEDRYAMNGVVITNEQHKNVLARMLGTMDGTLTHTSGKFHLQAGSFTNCGVHFDQDNVIGNLNLSTEVPFTEKINSIRGTYIDPNEGYSGVDFAPIQNTEYITEDGEQKWKDMELRFTTSATRAKRLARITLEKARRTHSFGALFDLTAYELKVGDIIEFSHKRFGWDHKTFRVKAWNLRTLSSQESSSEDASHGVELKLKEVDADIYKNAKEEPFEFRNEVSLSNPDVVAPPRNFSASNDPVVVEDGSVKPRLRLTWDKAIDAQVASGGRTEVGIKKSSDNFYRSVRFVDGSTEEVVLEEGLVPGNKYDVRIRSVSAERGRSEWKTIKGIELTGDQGVSQDVLGLDLNYYGTTLEIDWDPVPDSDHSHYELRAIKGDTFDFDNSTIIGHEVDVTRMVTNFGYLEDQNLTGGKITVGLKAVDQSGNRSEVWTTATIDCMKFQQVESAERTTRTESSLI